MKTIFAGLLLVVTLVEGLREPPVALRATSPINLEKVLDGKNLTAVVVGAKEVATNTIQVVLEANITSPIQTVTENSVENKTSVRVVYSAHDPRSIKLIRDGLLPLFKRPDIANVTSLQLVPFGKAVEVKVDDLSTGFLYWHPELKKANITAVYRCPNGEGECESSLIHACAISVSGDVPTVYLPFIACMSGAKPGTAPEDSSFSCSNSTSFMESIRTCALGPEGVKLQHQFATTASQTSDIPSVSINGKTYNVSEVPSATEISRIVCDTLFAEGLMDRDACQGKSEDPIVAPFQSILPAQTPTKATPTKA
jgi:hypothetical protein